MLRLFILLVFFLISSFSFTQRKKAPQRKAENAVIIYLQEQFSNSTLTHYDFGDLVKITPLEISEVERLKKVRSSLLAIDSNHPDIDSYNAIIDKQLKKITQEKLHTTFEIDHFYTVQNIAEKPVLYHSLFTLFPDGKVKNVSIVLNYPFTRNEEDDYFYFYKKYPFVVETDFEDKKFNLETYTYLNNLYLNEENDKEAAMSTVLTVTKIMSKTAYYDTTLIAQHLATKYMEKSFDIANLKDPTYSKVQPIKDSLDQILGYKLFLLYTDEGTEQQQKMYYFEYDYNYILRAVMPVEPPYEQYFINTK